MAEQILHLTVLVGSTRQGRFGPVVAEWFSGRAGGRPEFSVQVIDLADCALPPILGPVEDLPAPARARLDAVTSALAASDAFVVVTPEYNHSIPAALKNAIDWHTDQWHAKPVAFVSYGGLAGGLRAVEHLRLVFAELHAMTVRDTVSFHNVWDQFSDGQLKDPTRPNAAAEAMLGRLAWWARALREARTQRPYPSHA